MVSCFWMILLQGTLDIYFSKRNIKVYAQNTCVFFVVPLSDKHALDGLGSRKKEEHKD